VLWPESSDSIENSGCFRFVIEDAELFLDLADAEECFDWGGYSLKSAEVDLIYWNQVAKATTSKWTFNYKKILTPSRTTGNPRSIGPITMGGRSPRVLRDPRLRSRGPEKHAKVGQLAPDRSSDVTSGLGM
jgi:hypothetical protein